MKTAKELYPEESKDEEVGGYFFGTDNYQPIISEIGNILIQIDDSDYSGDSRILYEKDGKYGYLIFGWGSCAGCDELQACKSIQDIQEIIDRLVKSIHWYNSLEEIKEYFRTKDWTLSYKWYSYGNREFTNEIINY